MRVRDVNFFSVYHVSQSSDGAKKFNLISLSLIAGSLFIILLVFGVLKIAAVSVANKSTAEQAYLSGKEYAKIKSTLEESKAKISALNEYKKAAERVSRDFSSLPQIDSNVLANIASKLPADLDVDKAAYNSGTLTLSCRCKDKLSAAAFVHSLEQSGNFKDVNYLGISQTQSSTPYAFTVTLTLKGGTSK